MRDQRDLITTFGVAGHVEACEQGQIHPVVDRVFPFSEVREAMGYLSLGSHVGKVAVAFDGD